MKGSQLLARRGSELLLLQVEKLSVEVGQLLNVQFTKLLRHTLPLKLVVELRALGDELTNDLKLRSNRHVPNLALDFTEHWLQQMVFLFNRVLVI